MQGGELLLVSGEDLDAAEPVVVQGNYELEDGMAVEVEGPKVQFVDPLLRSAICVQTAGKGRGRVAVRY